MYFQLKFKRSYRTLCLLFLCATVVCAVLVGTGTVEKEVFSTGERSVKLPVLMYHSVCVNRRVSSEYVLSPERFYEDMDYLKRAGYTAVFPSEVIAFVRGEGILPEKPILITFDDGFYNNLSVCLPKLEECGFKALVSVVGAYVKTYSENADKNPAYAYLSYDDINGLLRSGCVEIGSHTYDMHSLKGRNGCTINKNEDEEVYRQHLTEDITALNGQLLMHCGVLPEVFAYPYGAVCEQGRQELIRLGFPLLLTCEEKIGTLTFGQGTPVTLGRINRYASMTTEAFMQKYGL